MHKSENEKIDFILDEHEQMSENRALCVWHWVRAF